MMTAISETPAVRSSPRDRVECYLRDVLARTVAGGKLPSVRKAMGECRASQRVVDRVLSRLQEEGLIETRPRSGLYKPAETARQGSVIEYLFFGDPGALTGDNFSSAVIGSVAAALARSDHSIRLRVMRKMPAPNAIVEELSGGERSVVLTHGLALEDVHLVQGFAARGARCVNLLPNMVEPVPPAITINDAQLVRQQVEHLLGFGHRRIGYLHAAREDRFFRPINVRRDTFCRLVLELGLEAQPAWVRYVGWDLDQVARQVHDLMSAVPRPSALIIYDNHVKTVYAVLRSLGLTIARDVSVIGTDDMPWAEHVEPPLTSVRVPRTQLAELAAGALDDILAGRVPAPVTYIDTHLVTRDSTGPTA